MENMDPITQRLMAAKLGDAGIVWGPHPLIRRRINAKGEERLQQLWVSNTQLLDWRDIPLFDAAENYVDEGDSAINTGPLLRVKAAGEAEPAVHSPPVQP